MNNQDKSNFCKLVDNSTLMEGEKASLKFILDFFAKKTPLKLSSKSFLFQGEPGVGKTFLALNLLKAMHKEIVYLSCNQLDLTNSLRCKSLPEVFKKTANKKEQIIFLDDLNFLMDKESDEIISKDKRNIMNLLNLIKDSSRKLLIITTNSIIDLDVQMIDRIEVIINLDLPSDPHKIKYLQENYKEYLDKSIINFLAKNTFGYNYRDLQELIKICYRLNKGKLDKNNLKDAINHYKPAELHGFFIDTDLGISFKDVIGKEKIRSSLNKIINVHKHQCLSEKLKIENANLLLFHGPPGTGKTFMAKAIAGELDCPLINIKGDDVRGSSSFRLIRRITEMSKRFKNCIIFIDEAEKLFGNHSAQEEDNALIGEFNRELGNGPVQSIIILAVNNIYLLGTALQDRFLCLEFENPVEEERSHFFKNKIRNLREPVFRKIDYNFLVKTTADLSFRELNHVWNELMFKYLEKKEIGTEDVSVALREFKSLEKNSLVG